VAEEQGKQMSNKGRSNYPRARAVRVKKRKDYANERWRYSKAWEQGANAREEGFPKDANPYKDPDFIDVWRDGWQYGWEDKDAELASGADREAAG
jgi:ribosome modulation factor